MRRTNLRTPMCSICGSSGKKKGGIKSETNSRVFYERYYICSNKYCPNADKPQSIKGFENSTRRFGER